MVWDFWSLFFLKTNKLGKNQLLNEASYSTFFFPLKYSREIGHKAA